MKILTNISENTLVLTDFQGLELDSGETIDAFAFGEQALRDSASIASELLLGNLSISDNYNTYTGLNAIDFIRGTATQVTRDGKPIITMSDRPKNTYRYVTSCGDDMSLQKIGDGPRAHLDIAPDSTGQVDLQFIEDIYIKDGYCTYSSTSDNSWLDVYVVCPAGVPFPAPSNNGNFDYTNGSWVPNGSGTGAYFILGTETKLYRFVNKMPLPSYSNLAEVEAAEPSLMPSPYILRFVAYNGSDATENMHCHIHIGCYRKNTIN